MWYYQVERQLALLFFEKNNNYEGPRVPPGTGVFGAFASYLTLISLSSFFLQSYSPTLRTSVIFCLAQILIARRKYAALKAAANLNGAGTSEGGINNGKTTYVLPYYRLGLRLQTMNAISV